jgi:hypothetical protein
MSLRLDAKHAGESLDQLVKIIGRELGGEKSFLIRGQYGHKEVLTRGYYTDHFKVNTNSVGAGRDFLSHYTT